MRLKVFGLFLAVQLLSLGIWYALLQGDTNVFQASAAAPENEMGLALQAQQQQGAVDSSPSLPPSTPMVLSDKQWGSYKITVRNWKDEHQLLYEQQVEMIDRVMQILPPQHTQNLEISLDYDSSAHRGWGGERIVILAAGTMSLSELVSVLIHETGHHVDASFLTPSDEQFPSAYHDGKKVLYNNDPSVAFYNLSWLGDEKRRNTQDQLDAVSGYGASNPHEDFAETYAFYVLHHADFEFLSKTDPVLKQKYDFMRNVVFRGKVFEGPVIQAQAKERSWDVTKLPYDLEEFLTMNR